MSWADLVRSLAAETALPLCQDPDDPVYWMRNSTVVTDVDPLSQWDASVVTIPGLSSVVLMEVG